MRIGVVSDVHGNAPALEAVLRDAASLGIERWLALGDLVFFGPRPTEVLELLDGLPDVAFVRGNTDRYVVTGDQPPVHATAEEAARDPELVRRYGLMAAGGGWTRGVLTVAGWIDWLAALPDHQRVDLPGGTRLLAVHASPDSDDGDGIDRSLPDDALESLLDGCDADVVVGGHTHVPTDRRVGSVRALNPGSVGMPRTPSEGAAWMVLDASGDTLAVDHRRSPFDVDAVAADAYARRHPNADFLELRLSRDW